MDFDQRLQKAIDRGQRTRVKRSEEEARKALTEEELKRMHSQYRLAVSEHVEAGLRRLADHFPGFAYESVVSDRGWGGTISQDRIEVNKSTGRRENLFSRLEMVVRPHSSYNVLELSAKGTVCNKEIFNRNHYQQLEEADPDSFSDLADLWILEYAELLSANS